MDQEYCGYDTRTGRPVTHQEAWAGLRIDLAIVGGLVAMVLYAFGSSWLDRLQSSLCCT